MYSRERGDAKVSRGILGQSARYGTGQDLRPGDDDVPVLGSLQLQREQHHQQRRFLCGRHTGDDQALQVRLPHVRRAQPAQERRLFELERDGVDEHAGL